MPTVPLRERPAWKALEQHHAEIAGRAPAPAVRRRSRARRAPHRRGGRPLPRLLQAPRHRRDAAAAGRTGRGVRLRERIDAMFRGDKINVTENRAVLHVALRAPRGQLDRGRRRGRGPGGTRGARPDGGFSDRIRSGEWKGHTGKPIRNVINIGIGGSDLGPVMAYEALRHYSRARPDLPLRLERGRHRLRRGHPRSGPGRDAVHHLLQDVHHARDASPTPTRPATGRSPGSATTRRSPSTSSRSRPTPRRSPSSASTPRTCSASGTGSAAATRWTRPSACPRCSRSAPTHFREMLAGFHAMDEHFRTAPLEREPAGPDGPARRLVRRLLRRADRRRCCPTSST